MSLDLNIKSFDALISPRGGSAAQYFSKDDPDHNLSSIVWQSEDLRGFQDDFCFEMQMFEYKSGVRGGDLIDNEEFVATVRKTGSFVTRYNWIPASLLIGKKTGDSIKLKDGSVVHLTCHSFMGLHHRIQRARDNCASEASPKREMLLTRLNEIDALVSQYYDYVDTFADEPSRFDAFVAALKKVLSVIINCFKEVAQRITSRFQTSNQYEIIYG